MNWTRAEQHLPKPGKPVLVRRVAVAKPQGRAIKNPYRVAHIRIFETGPRPVPEWIEFGSGIRLTGVTHWADITPPEDA